MSESNESMQARSADSSTEVKKSVGGQSWLPILVAGFAAVLIAYLVIRGAGPSADGRVHLAVGKPMPDFDLVQLTEDVTPVSVTSPAAGEVVLLHFWGTWCPPCRMEYPHLSEMAANQTSDRFRFVPVSCGGRGDTLVDLRHATMKFFRKSGVESPIYADPRGYTLQSSAERLEQSSMFFPTSILIGPDGKVAGVWVGYSPEAVTEIKMAIDDLL